MMTDKEKEQQRVEWEAFAAECRRKGKCEFSGLLATRCVDTICDCFETREGAEKIEREAGLRP